MAGPPENALIGAWRLVRAERRLSNGSVDYPYGAVPVGLVIYDAAGYMSVQIMRSDDGLTPAPSESQRVRAAARSYIAYCGTYEMDTPAGIVRHRVTASVNSNWVGSVQIRRFKLEGDCLIFVTDDASGDPSVLYWVRLPPVQAILTADHAG